MPLQNPKKEIMFSLVHGFENKGLDDSGNLIKAGYIATTHLDSGWYDEDRGKLVRDKIDPKTLEKWAQDINDGNPRANKANIFHQRDPQVVGVALKGTAKVEKLPDGEYGLYTEVLVDKTREDFQDIKYRLDTGLIDSFSIEYDTGIRKIGDYYPGAASEKDMGGFIQRTLLPGTALDGFAMLSQPMNENAIMIKGIHPEVLKEEQNMVEEIKASTQVPIPEQKTILSAEEQEMIALGRETKTRQSAEQKDKELSELKMNLKKDILAEVQKMQPEQKVKIDNTPETQVPKELGEFKAAMNNQNIGAQFKAAAKFAESKGFIGVGTVKQSSIPAEARKFNIEIKKSNGKYMIESKAIGITTNQNSDTDYLLSAAELADVFDPVIYNALNQQTVTWNILAKDDFSNKGNNQVQFTLKTAANTTAAAYTGNAVNTGNVTRLKFQTKFKKYAVGVEVDGDMIAAARGGPIGDVFAQEVRDSTMDLLAAINVDLFAEVGLETAAGVLGFEFIADSAGNTTMYSLTRSAANKLGPTAAGDTYINGASADISFDNMRAAKRQALKEGAQIQNLVYITDHIQGDKIRGKLMASQRFVPTSSRAGFTGMMEFDGIPVFEDKDCNDDDCYLVDLETHRVAIWVPPTLEMLGKDADSQKGFIKTYFATYNRAPRRLVMIYGNATT
jgi:hypothetical protein